MGAESKLAHQLLDGKRGIEIGAASHNPFGLQTLNISNDIDGFYTKAQGGNVAKVDVCADGACLPFRDSSFDFVISSHVLEHFFDPIKTLKEWHRVTRHEGIIFAIIPHKERTFDKARSRTPLAELIARTEQADPHDPEQHWSVWITQDVQELIQWLGWPLLQVQDVDDKVGNGFTIVARVEK